MATPYFSIERHAASGTSLGPILLTSTIPSETATQSCHLPRAYPTRTERCRLSSVAHHCQACRVYNHVLPEGCLHLHHTT
jgi:uncharacterized SAM-dependent methyltransferase